MVSNEKRFFQTIIMVAKKNLISQSVNSIAMGVYFTLLNYTKEDLFDGSFHATVSNYSSLWIRQGSIQKV